MRQLKWQFMFRYLMEEGRAYDLREFVMRFAWFVAEETGQADRGALLALLSQQLAPSMRGAAT